MKDILVFSLHFLAYPVICGSLIHNGLITSLSLYPIKYLNEFLLPYDSFLETNIIYVNVFNVIYLFVFVEAAFLDFFVNKIYVLSTHS